MEGGFGVRIRAVAGIFCFETECASPEPATWGSTPTALTLVSAARDAFERVIVVTRRRHRVRGWSRAHHRHSLLLAPYLPEPAQFSRWGLPAVLTTLHVQRAGPAFADGVTRVRNCQKY